jgi:hypothetical protein
MVKKRFELLTDALWALIEPLLPEPRRRKDNRGRPVGLESGLSERHIGGTQDGRGVAVSAG